jgi:hypothetical protein
LNAIGDVYASLASLSFSDYTADKISMKKSHRLLAALMAVVPSALMATAPLGYTFQTGYGGIAMSDDGFLFGAWSARDEGSAGKVAVKDCEKLKGKKSCSVVATGAAVFPPTFKPKAVKAKK